MTSIKRLASRSTSLLTAVAFVAAFVAPTFTYSAVYAAGAPSPRKLTQSSQASGSVSTDANGNAVAAGSGGNGAKTNYRFDYTLATTGNVGSIVYQYCTSPLYGTTCVTPAGLDTSTVTTIATQSGFAATAPTLDTTTNASTGSTFFTGTPCTGSGLARQNCILVKRTTAVSDSGAVSMSFGQGAGTDWIKNPTATGPFYVRITTFSDTTYTTVVDQGAVAGSVNTGIDINTRVQEKLNFSVAPTTGATVPGTTCAPFTGTGALSLGNAGVLDTQTTYDVHSYFRLSTNSSNGVGVYYSGDTLKTSNLANSINAIGTTATQANIGTSQFGLAIDSSDTQTGSGYSFTNLTASTVPTDYSAGTGTLGSAGTKFAFSTASVTTPVQVASASAGTTVSCDTGSVRYIANISPLTKPGLYQTTISYIAVPTF